MFYLYGGACMYCNLGNVSVYYETFGEGFPIVLIHGFTPDHRLMTGCMEPVFENQPGWHRIYLDLPGMGQTKGRIGSKALIRCWRWWSVLLTTCSQRGNTYWLENPTGVFDQGVSGKTTRTSGRNAVYLSAHRSKSRPSHPA